MMPRPPKILTFLILFALASPSSGQTAPSADAKRERVLRELRVATKAQPRSPELLLIQRALQKAQTVDGGNISGGSDRVVPISDLAVSVETKNQLLAELSRFQLELTGISTLHERGLDGTGSAVAVIDSGIEPSVRAAANVAFFRDFTGECHNLCDSDGHGSLVADLINQAAPKATLYSLKVMRGGPQQDLQAVVDALDWVLDNHQRYSIKVVNVSLMSPARYFGSRTLMDEARDLVNALAKQSVLVVAPTGNDYRNQVRDFPANVPGSLAVGSVTHGFSPDPTKHHLSDFSNYGFVPAPVMVERGSGPVRDFALSVPKPEVLFFGEDLVACLRQQCFLVSGTSFGSALLTGGLALLIPAFGDLHRAELVELVERQQRLPSLLIHPRERAVAYSVQLDRIFEGLTEARKNQGKN